MKFIIHKKKGIITMKFSNGCWLQKESCSCFSPQEVYFTTIEETKVTILAPTIHITQRGDTLGCINLTLEITSPAPDIIRVRTWHHKGAIVNTPSFDLEFYTFILAHFYIYIKLCQYHFFSKRKT